MKSIFCFLFAVSVFAFSGAPKGFAFLPTHPPKITFVMPHPPVSVVV